MNFPEHPPYPYTEEDYEMMCEVMGSFAIDQAIEEHENESKDGEMREVSH